MPNSRHAAETLSMLRVAILGAAFLANTASAQLTNGSFEFGVEPGAFLLIPSFDSSSIDGWRVTFGSVDSIEAVGVFEPGPAAATAAALRQRGLSYVAIVDALTQRGFSTSETAAGIGSVMHADPIGFVVDTPPAVARILAGAGLDATAIARALRDVFFSTTAQTGEALLAARLGVAEISSAIADLVAADSDVPSGEKRPMTGHELARLGLDENTLIFELRGLFGLSDAHAFALIADDWLNTRAAQNGLIVRYAERFLRSEQRGLSSVDWYLGNAHAFDLCNQFGCSSFTGGLAQLTSLGKGGGSADDWSIEPDLSGNLDILAGDVPSAKTYVHVLRRDSFTDIQHWLFYPATGPPEVRCLLQVDGTDFGCFEENFPFGSSTTVAEMGGHTGHWETITLRFDNTTNQLTGGFMSEFGEVRPYAADELTFNDTGDVLAYAGLYTQANYALEPDIEPVPNEHEVQRLSFVPGLKDLCIGWEIVGQCAGLNFDFFSSTLELYLINRTHGLGHTVFEPDWSASENRELVAINGEPVPGAEWIAFPGRWGAPAFRDDAEAFRLIRFDEMKYYLGLMEAARVLIFGGICALGEAIIPLPLCAGFDLYFELRKMNLEDWVNDIIDFTNATSANTSVSPALRGTEWVYDQCPKDGFTDSRGYGFGTEVKSIDIDPGTWPDRFSEDHVFFTFPCGEKVPAP